MTIHSLLKDDTILPDLEVEDKDALLNKMVDVLKADVSGEQLEAIRRAVLERESIMSTGVGKGLAIPHGKVNGIDQSYASFAILRNPIDFDAVDNQPVRIVFLLVGPESESSRHIKLLSRISKLMINSAFREALIDCSTAGEILGAFREEEEDSKL